jgi:hypothetical protein
MAVLLVADANNILNACYDYAVASAFTATSSVLSAAEYIAGAGRRNFYLPGNAIRPVIL